MGESNTQVTVDVSPRKGPEMSLAIRAKGVLSLLSSSKARFGRQMSHLVSILESRFGLVSP